MGVFLLCSSVAAANGRFPRAQRLLQSPVTDQELVLSGTYGLTVTFDQGQTSFHRCESAFASETLQGIDSVVDFASDGSLLISFGEAMARAVSPFCDYDLVLGGAATDRVADFTLSPDRKRVIAVINRRAADGTTLSQLVVSKDTGLNFTNLGPTLPEVASLAVTLDIAPSAPDTLYVTGIDSEGQGVLLVSQNGGESFEVRPMVLAWLRRNLRSHGRA